ncbi:MAG TPA: hypothetical protein VNF07_05570 [Acidimicrobiales bacterium]|nr:hypothetical protein [Acidimicrobiales bacterium]
MPELPSSSPSGPTPDELLAHVFPSARRGLDPEAVHGYLVGVAEVLRRLQAREAELSERLTLAERPATPQPLDAAALSAAVGQETARVLQAAHEAAEDVLTRANTEAEALRASATNLLEDEQRRASAAAAAITAAASAEAERLTNAAREECRQMVEVARAARHRILVDLGERRRELHIQLEQLRAGKDALADVVDAVASYVVHSVEELKGQLAGAEEGARLAAEAVAAAPSAFVEELSEEGLLAEAAELAALEAAAVGAVPALTVELTEALLEVPVADEEVEAADGVAEPPVVVESEGAAQSEPPEGARSEADEEESSNAIDELFAKIRQSRAEQVERARTVLEDSITGEPPAAEEAPPAATPAAPPEGAAGGQRPAATGSDETAAGAGSAEATAADAPAEPLASGEGAVADPAAQDRAPSEDDASGRAEAEEEPEPADESLAARNKLLASSTAELTRVLKRQLRLEQNQLLDAFRNMKKGGDPLSLLPGAEMSGRLEQDVRDALVAAFAAGRGFAASSISRDPGPLRQPVAAVKRVATELGAAVLDPIRRRVEQGLTSEGEEPAVAIGAAFREWKGAGAEQTAADFTVRAFSAGVLDQARASGSAVTWIVDDGDQRCPDCDDNAIAGAQPPGEPFPTGHAHPPIHPGCRCLLVLSPA